MSPEKLVFEYPDPKTLHIKIDGDWRIPAGYPPIGRVAAEQGGHSGISHITFSVAPEIKWDSGLVSFLFELIKGCESKKITVQREGLPRDIQKLLVLVLAGGERKPPPKEPAVNFFEKVGGTVLEVKDSTLSVLDFLGQTAFSFSRFLKGKAYFRRDDFMYVLQRCGCDALPLVSLISILIGIILAFVGAIQLKIFGAQIFIADMVGIAMVRVMGAFMAAVLMSGRTGSSFAAELGLMRANEEIDALETLGVNPVEFLVLPRVLALVLMMPLLTIYADCMGIVGGFIVSTGMLDINPTEYLHRTRDAVRLTHLWIGLVHGLVFGVIIAMAGCYHGIKCGRSAVAVGAAATSAVVSSVIGIVIATAIITYICHVLGV
jgi:phospholipid/cholesterol/gamma-HCH transport system permease protein